MRLEGVEDLIEQAVAGLKSELGVFDELDSAPATRDFRTRCTSLLRSVARWNRVHDLTAARQPERLVDLYVADAWIVSELERRLSRAAAPVSDQAPRTGPAVAEPEAPEPHSAEPHSAEHWVEVGSGGGAPGLVLALMNPVTRFSLVEPRRKRAAFLRSAVGELGLVASTCVMVTRSEHLPTQGFDVAISRATLTPPRWLDEGRRLARRRVWVLGVGDAALTVEHLDRVLQLGWHEVARCSYHWPLTKSPRLALCFAQRPRNELRS